MSEPSMALGLYDNGPALELGKDQLVMRFPAGDYTDIWIGGFVSTIHGSSLREFHVQPWPDEEIARWHVRKRKFDKVGRHIGRLIRAVGRSPRGSGIVQRIAQWRDIPLIDPPKSNTTVMGGIVDWASTTNLLHAPDAT